MKYAAIFRIHFIATLNYRMAALAGMVTQFAWASMLILFYRALYETDPAAFPMTFSQTTDYIWLQQSLLNLFALWIYDGSIFKQIETGDVATQFLRPLDLYDNWYIHNLAMRLARTLLRCLPTLLIALCIPQPYGLSISLQTGLFLVSLFFSSALVVAFLMFVYLGAFYLLSPVGIKVFVGTIGEFLTGAIIPLPFLPPTVQKWINYTPFAYMQNISFRLYSGDLQGIEWIIWQLLWLVGLILLGKVAYAYVTRFRIIQGG